MPPNSGHISSLNQAVGRRLGGIILAGSKMEIVVGITCRDTLSQNGRSKKGEKLRAADEAHINGKRSRAGLTIT